MKKNLKFVSSWDSTLDKDIHWDHLNQQATGNTNPNHSASTKCHQRLCFAQVVLWFRSADKALLWIENSPFQGNNHGIARIHGRRERVASKCHAMASLESIQRQTAPQTRGAMVY